MSIRTPGPGTVRAERPAERTLFRGLIDDAAVFPPGLAPLPRAVEEHLARQSQPYADLVGPLLVPVSAAAELRAVPRDQPLTVVLIARPGTARDLVAGALDELAGDPATSIAGVELGWSQGWQESLAREFRGIPVSVEVPAGAEQAVALEDLREHTSAGGAVQAKLRTGSTPDTSVPTATELARFIRTCVDMDLGFKLTGGLHHALAHTSPEGEEQHGLLNVLAATRWALAHAAEVPELEALLQQRDPLPLLEIATRMSEADASVVRAFFTAYGCCGVMDPIGELSTMGLIEETV